MFTCMYAAPRASRRRPWWSNVDERVKRTYVNVSNIIVYRICSKYRSGSPTHTNTRHEQHHATHDTNNTTNDHTKNHPPHLTMIEGGAATVRATSHIRKRTYVNVSNGVLYRIHPIHMSTTLLCWDGAVQIRGLQIRGLKVPCAPKQFSSSFSYSTCTNDFGAVTHNERRIQFRLFNHLFRIVPGFMGKSKINRWWSASELETEIRSDTWAKRFYIWCLLSSCRAPLTRSARPRRWTIPFFWSVSLQYDWIYVCRYTQGDIYLYSKCIP